MPIRLGPHVEQLAPETGRAYPGGGPLVVTGADTRLVIDSTLTTELPGHDGFLISHHHEDHVAGIAASGKPAAVHPADLASVSDWSAFTTACGYPDPRWVTLMNEDFQWAAIENVRPLDLDTVHDLGGGVTVRAIHLPGHTPGHCGFLIEPDGVFYLGDIDLTRFGPYYGDAHADLTGTRQSLDAVESIPAAVRATYHQKGPFQTDADFLTALRDYREILDRRHHQVAEAYAQDPSVTAERLVGQGIVYRPGRSPSWGPDAERRMIQRHLDELRG
ncbi:glyoxylase-like metal-dependent hydrolase (beta-lactamase superfamily II) [Crossiella equi]|uniref:Glyoxylase-like metal-dependent hydrolase (Beta-lactamase superfamily II) n=1 Tax=Crossiella equi TaxID=130796 RepID=A0ABS5A6K5_9PSEU|nr:MBL fold metallo-hydrolase [Crossiella equi]MBP2472223.1 glyoxylase-like metal-dependent hydrolase (beta-lactamase superfamily II) [Crossiella equi]